MDVLSLRAVLTLDKSEYDKGLNTAGSKAGSFGSKFASVMGTAAKVGSAALAAFAVSSIKVGADFDKSMSQVAATMGYTVDELHTDGSEAQKTYEKLEKAAREAGKTTAFSASEASEALNYMALAGYDANTSIEMMPKVLNLAAAGNMELATASDMVTDTQSALGLSLDETTELVDKMAKASSKSNTSVEQLGQAMLTVGGTAKMLKGGTTELSTALGILADNGTKGAEGGTALRNILTSISGSKFEKSFGKLGVSAYDADGKMRSLKDIFTDMNKAMEGMTDQEKTGIINKTFNARDLKNVNALLATSTDRWDELSGAIEDSEGAAEAMAETQLDNLSGDVTILKSAFSELQITVSDLDGGVLRTFVQGATEAINMLTDVINAGSLGEAMEILNQNFSKALDFIKNGLEDFGNNFLPNANAVITDGIMKAMQIDWSGVFSSVFLGLGSAFRTIFSIQLGIDKLKTTVMQGIMAVGTDMIMGLVDAIVKNGPEMAGSAIDVIYGFMEGIVANVTLLVESAIKMINTLVDYLSENSGDMAQGAVDIVIALVKGIVANAPKVIVGITKLNLTITKGILKIVPKLPGLALKMVASLASALARGVGRIKNAVGKLASGAFNKLKDGFIDKVKRVFPLNIGKIFSGMKLPHFSVSGKAPFGIGGAGEKPKISVSWYKKAYDEPYLFTKPTIMSGLGFGDGVGDEMVYGKKNLMNDITEAIERGGRQIVVNNNLTVNGSDDPEEWGMRFANAFELKVRAGA